MMRSLFAAAVLSLLGLPFSDAQSTSPAAAAAPPKAIFTPKPVYRPEWAKQNLSGKGVVLVTIDTKTGRVAGARMLESTGNQLLDGAALQAYSQWRFEPGSIPQVKIPVQFASRQQPKTASRKPPKPAILYPLLILAGFVIATIAMRAKRRPS
jgi:TonB family protein